MAPTPSTTRREGVSIILLILLFILWPGGESACNGHLNVLRERRAAVCSVPSETVLPANESKLVHMTGEFRAQPGALTDPEFGVSAEGFALVRTCTSLGTNEGGATSWSADRQPCDLTRPIAYQTGQTSRVWRAGEARLGAYTLSPELFSLFLSRRVRGDGSVLYPATYGADYLVLFRLFQAPGRELPVTAETEARLPAEQRGRWKVAGGRLYAARCDPDHPKDGDSYFTYKVVDLEPVTVSLMAQQKGGRLEVYHDRPGHPDVTLMEFGEHSAESMLQSAEDATINGRWGLRAVALVMFLTAVGLIVSARRARNRTTPVGG